jgi:hypothetical protein
LIVPHSPHPIPGLPGIGTITVSIHIATKKQPKVDKTPNGPIIELVTVAMRGDDVTSRNGVRLSKFPVILPVLRENGTAIGTASLRMIGGKDFRNAAIQYVQYDNRVVAITTAAGFRYRK